jgi:uncharacterized protein YjgD (DUF1641 family)
MLIVEHEGQEDVGKRGILDLLLDARVRQLVGGLLRVLRVVVSGE